MLGSIQLPLKVSAHASYRRKCKAKFLFIIRFCTYTRYIQATHSPRRWQTSWLSSWVVLALWHRLWWVARRPRFRWQRPRRSPTAPSSRRHARPMISYNARPMKMLQLLREPRMSKIFKLEVGTIYIIVVEWASICDVTCILCVSIVLLWSQYYSLRSA